MAPFLFRFTAVWLRLHGRKTPGILGALFVSAWVVFGVAGCASPSRLERRLEAIERRLELMNATGPASTSAEPVDVEIKRLRADIDDIRLLLLDLQMKAGR